MSGEELKRDALAKLLCLMDTFAGEGLGHAYGNGQVIDADDASLELCEAFGIEFDAGWWRKIPEQIFAHPLPEQPQEGVRDHLEAYQVLRGFMCSLTNGGRNRATHLSINHDELRGLLAEADKVCTAQSLAFRSPPSTETKESGE